MVRSRLWSVAMTLHAPLCSATHICLQLVGVLSPIFRGRPGGLRHFGTPAIDQSIIQVTPKLTINCTLKQPPVDAVAAVLLCRVELDTACLCPSISEINKLVARSWVSGEQSRSEDALFRSVSVFRGAKHLSSPHRVPAGDLMSRRRSGASSQL